MIRIDADVIRNLITEKDELYVPERITRAIGTTVMSDVDDINNEISRLVQTYKQYVTHDGPTIVDYSAEITTDAYAVNYLPRNTLIPKLLFMSLAYHKAFQNMKDEINILDLGSGTGGVVLGLLDLFKDKPLSDIKINIMSCERSEPALKRQRALLEETQCKNCNIWHCCADVTDKVTYKKIITKLSPYDYIIAANLFSELELDDIKLVLSELPSIMAQNGVLLIADPPRQYVDKLKIYISDILKGLGLFMYYPCPPAFQCPKDKCQWVWLNYKFECPSIEICGDSLETAKFLSTTWLIFCRNKCSIYEFLQGKEPDLTWGVTYPIGKEFNHTEKKDYIVCTGSKFRKVTHTRKEALIRHRTEVILRGNILGFNDDFSRVLVWDPIYGLSS